MPTQQIPVVCGVVSRRHAKLLHHLFQDNNNGGNAPVKDLRIRRVVPPASSAPPPDASPDPPALAKPKPKPVPAIQIQIQVQVQSTPPEPTAAEEDRERKPRMLLPRSKLVRDPGSFGYRRLLPFLNQMAANNNGSDAKDAPSVTSVSLPTKEPSRSDSGLVGEAVDSVEPVVPEAAVDRGIKDCSDTVTQEAQLVPADPASSKPCVVTRCARSKFVHHPTSFSYKRMLPFLRENDISSQEEDRAKIRRVSEEEHITSDENRVVEEMTSVSDGNCAGQIQSATAEAPLDASSTAEAQRATEQVPASVADPVSAEKGDLTSDTSAALAGEQRQLAVSEDTLKKRNLMDFLEPLVSKDGGDREMKDRCDIVKERAALAGGQRQLAVSEDTPKKRNLMDFLEPLVAKDGGDQEMKDRCDSVKEQTSIVPGDIASGKPCPSSCTRSRLVHQKNSFSYKRMLPFLMADDISSQEGDRAKFQSVPEEKPLTSDESVMASGDHHLSNLKYSAEVERILEEIASAPYENCLVKGGQLQSAVTEVSLDVSTAEVQKVAPEVVLSLDKDKLPSDGDGVLAGAQCQLAVSEDLPKESSVAEAEGIVVEEKAIKSDENSVLDGTDLHSAVSEVSVQEGDADVMEEATQKQVLTSVVEKGESLVKDQPQLCDSQKLLQDNAELAEVQQCQSSESGCSDVGLGSPTNTAKVDGRADRHGVHERQVFVASPDALLLDVAMISKPSDPCASDTPLSAEEISGCLTKAETGLRKFGTLRPCGSPSLGKQCLSPKNLSPVNGAFSGGVSCLKKRVLSPKKLSPKKGILKRQTMGCRGICMCLDCSVFRLRADRAFEFSRKQMREADDIIDNLLEEVASLRSLAEKPSGQQEQIEEACQRATRVEEVARERQRQMQVELNAHCKIPGPRVKFAQYVDEKMASSPPCGNSSNCRRQPPL